MKERPILFSAPMVNAILSGRKTQTRRIVKPQPKAATVDCVNLDMIYPDEPWCWLAQWLGEDGKPLSYEDAGGGWPDCSEQFACPYGKPGDRLWVRESFQPLFAEGVRWSDADYSTGEGYAINYVATGGVKEFNDESRDESLSTRITPSIHMPRWASRITLEITEVRVQRLHEISEEDAKAEGAQGGCLVCGDETYGDCVEHTRSYIDGFANIWQSINGEESWHANPWVWAIGFRRVTA